VPDVRIAKAKIDGALDRDTVHKLRSPASWLITFRGWPRVVSRFIDGR